MGVRIPPGAQKERPLISENIAMRGLLHVPRIVRPRRGGRPANV